MTNPNGIQYTPEIAKEICERLAMGESLRAICRDAHMPDESSVREWAIYNKHNFSEAYTKARNIGLDAMADMVLEIADDGTNDYVEKKVRGEKKVVLNTEHVTRSRLRCDKYQWYLSKMAPKKYGERITTEVTNPDGSLTNMNETQLAAKLNAIHAAASKRLKEKEEAEQDDASDLI